MPVACSDKPVAGTTEQGCNNIPLIYTPLFTMKSIVIPLHLHRSEGIGAITTYSQLPGPSDHGTYSQSLGSMGVMATSTYVDLCPGSQHVGMVLRNLSAREVCIPPKTDIGNVQTAAKVPDWEMLGHTGEDLLPKE